MVARSLLRRWSGALDAGRTCVTIGELAATQGHTRKTHQAPERTVTVSVACPDKHRDSSGVFTACEYSQNLNNVVVYGINLGRTVRRLQ